MSGDGDSGNSSLRRLLRSAERHPLRWVLLVWLLLCVIVAVVAVQTATVQREHAGQIANFARQRQASAVSGRPLQGTAWSGTQFADADVIASLLEDPTNAFVIRHSSINLGRVAPVFMSFRESVWSRLPPTSSAKSPIDGSKLPTTKHFLETGRSNWRTADGPNDLVFRSLHWGGAARLLMLLQIAALVVVLTPVGAVVARRRWRAWHGACGACGYSRTGLGDGRPCPECGVVPPPRAASRRGFCRVATIGVMGAALIVGAVLAMWPRVRSTRIMLQPQQSNATMSSAPTAKTIIQHRWRGWPAPVVSTLVTRSLRAEDDADRLEWADPADAWESTFRRGWRLNWVGAWSWTSAGWLPEPGVSNQRTILLDNVCVNVLVFETLVVGGLVVAAIVRRGFRRRSTDIGGTIA